MPFTTTDVIRETLRDLTRLGNNQAVDADDSAAVNALLPGIVADLFTHRVAYIDLTSIPDWVFPDFVKVVAERVAPRFGRQTNLEALTAAEARLSDAARLDRTAGTALTHAVLDRLSSLKLTTSAADGTAVVDYTARVLADLQARHITTIASEAAISPAQFPHMVVLVAARVHPGSADAATVEAAENGLRAQSRLAQSGLTGAVLGQLEIWGVGQASVDAATVAARVPKVLAYLRQRGILTAFDESDVADEAWDDVVLYIAAKLAPTPHPDVLAMSEMNLRRLYGTDPSREPVVSVYF